MGSNRKSTSLSPIPLYHFRDVTLSIRASMRYPGAAMATEKQIAANRRNALKSTGPKTLRGKQNSSRNALKHGIFSKYRQTIPGEDDPAYQRLFRGFCAEFQPESPFEVELVGRLALIHWQQDRDFALHTSIINNGRSVALCPLTTPPGLISAPAMRSASTHAN